MAGGDEDPFKSRQEMGGTGLVNTRIADRETAYQARHRNQMVSGFLKESGTGSRVRGAGWYCLWCVMPDRAHVKMLVEID